MARTPGVAASDHEVVEVLEEKDPVVWWLQVAIGFVIVMALVAVLYGLLVGIVNPMTPRTAMEAKLVLLEQVVKDTPGAGTAWRDYAVALYAAGKKSEAKQVLAQSKKAVKNLDRVYPLLIEIDMLWTDGEYEQVVKKSQSAYKANLKYRDDWVKMKAREGRKISDLDFDNKDMIAILLYEARANGALKKWEAAVEPLDKALALDPMASDLYVLRAEAHLNAGDEDKARKDYEAALKFIPDMDAAVEGLKKLDAGK